MEKVKCMCSQQCVGNLWNFVMPGAPILREPVFAKKWRKSKNWIVFMTNKTVECMAVQRHIPMLALQKIKLGCVR